MIACILSKLPLAPLERRITLCLPLPTAIFSPPLPLPPIPDQPSYLPLNLTMENSQEVPRNRMVQNNHPPRLEQQNSDLSSNGSVRLIHSSQVSKPDL